MAIFTKEQIRQLIKDNNLNEAKDIQGMLKNMFAETQEKTTSNDKKSHRENDSVHND